MPVNMTNASELAARGIIRRRSANASRGHRMRLCVSSDTGGPLKPPRPYFAGFDARVLPSIDSNFPAAAGLRSLAPLMK